MPGDKCILQLRGLPPFFSPKYDLKQHPNYRYTAEADKQKNAFDLDRLINRRRRPGLNEACTMYEVAVPDDALCLLYTSGFRFIQGLANQIIASLGRMPVTASDKRRQREVAPKIHR